MKLPEGILYSSGKKWYFNDLYVKGETIGNDFIERYLFWPDADNEDDATNKLEDSLTMGSSFKMHQAYGRNGCFDDEDLFLVFEKEDLEELEQMIAKAKEAINV